MLIDGGFIYLELFHLKVWVGGGGGRKINKNSKPPSPPVIVKNSEADVGLYNYSEFDPSPLRKSSPTPHTHTQTHFSGTALTLKGKSIIIMHQASLSLLYLDHW